MKYATQDFLTMYRFVVKDKIYNSDQAESLASILEEEKTKAKDMPKSASEFIARCKAGDSLMFSLYLIDVLHDAKIKSYLTVTPERENDVRHYSVLVATSNGHYFICDPGEEVISGSTYDYVEIDYDTFKKEMMRDDVRHYDMYGESGEVLFFSKDYFDKFEVQLPNLG